MSNKIPFISYEINMRNNINLDRRKILAKINEKIQFLKGREPSIKIMQF